MNQANLTNLTNKELIALAEATVFNKPELNDSEGLIIELAKRLEDHI